MNEKANRSKASPDARTAETRERLLAATLKCLARAGIAGTTSREIARASGTNLQAIVYHFGSKDELVAEALLSAIRSWIQPALDILAKDMDPVRRMLQAIKALQRAFGEAEGLLPVYLEALVYAKRDEVFGAKVRTLMSELHGFMSKHIGDLKKKGSIPRWVDPDAMATLQIAAVDGVALHAALDPNGVDPRKIATQGVRLLIAARKEPKRKQRAR